MTNLYMGVKTVIRHPESLNKLEATGQYIIEPKLDGIFCSIHTNDKGVIDKIISRHGKIKTTKGFSKFLGRDLVLKDSILIGELITKKAELHIFDIVKLLGHDVSTLDNERRRSILERLHIYVEGITLVPRYKNKFLEHFNEIIKAGGEGLVVKKIGKGTHYIPNSRTTDWMKLKKAMTMDYVIMGYDISTSKSHPDMIKNIHLGLYKNGKLEKVGLVGSMKMKEREFFTKEGHKLIGKVVEVGGNEVFPSGAMRHPYFIKMRPDLTRHDASLEKVEIKEDVDWEQLDKLLSDWMREGNYLWIYQVLKDRNDIPKNLRSNLLNLGKEGIVKKTIANKYYYETLMNMLGPIEYTQSNIDKIKTSASKLPNKPLKLKEDFLTPEQEIVADKAVERADELLARGEKEGFSQELFKELAIQCLIGQVSYPVISESRYRWKNFNTQQAENVLNKIKSTDPIFKDIPREWIRMLLKRFKESIGKGIKDTEKNIKKMKSSASKLPNKPLKLEDYLKNWAIGDEQFYEPQYGDGRISKDTFDKMPRKKKKKTLAKKIMEMWATGTDRLSGDNRLSDPDNKTGSYEIDDIIQPPHKLKKKKGKKVKLPHQGIEYPPKFYVENDEVDTPADETLYNHKGNWSAKITSLFTSGKLSFERAIHLIANPPEQAFGLNNLDLIKTKFNGLKALDGLKAYTLYLLGCTKKNEDKIDYAKLQDLLMKFDNGEYTIEAGVFPHPSLVLTWPKFNYAKAEKFLESKGINIAEIKRWPKGIEATKGIIDKLKLRAQKLPEKKLKLEGWASGSDKNSGKRYKSDEEDDEDEFEKLARDTYYDANASAYSKRKKKRKKVIKESYDKEKLTEIAKEMFVDILETSISNLKTWAENYIKNISEEDLNFLLSEMKRLEKEKFPNPTTGGFHVRNTIAEISKIFKSKSLKEGVKYLGRDLGITKKTLNYLQQSYPGINLANFLLVNELARTRIAEFINVKDKLYWLLRNYPTSYIKEWMLWNKDKIKSIKQPIKWAEEKINKIKSSASKLPNKPLKLESFLNELKGLDEEIVLVKARKLYTEIKELLKPIVSKIELVGSASRLHDVVNDLDIVAVPKRDIKTYLEEKGIQATSGAEKVINFNYKGTPINIWATPKESFGASVLHFSSGKGIIQLKQKAIQMGLKLNRYGLFKGDRKIAGENYDEILKILGTETKFSKIRLLEKVVENCEEVDRFIREGQFPRITENYYRFRQIDPKKFEEGSFRTLKSSSGNAKIIGKINGKMKIQSLLIQKSKLTEKDIQDYLKLVIK